MKEMKEKFGSDTLTFLKSNKAVDKRTHLINNTAKFPVFPVVKHWFFLTANDKVTKDNYCQIIRNLLTEYNMNQGKTLHSHLNSTVDLQASA